MSQRPRLDGPLWPQEPQEIVMSRSTHKGGGLFVTPEPTYSGPHIPYLHTTGIMDTPLSPPATTTSYDRILGSETSSDPSVMSTPCPASRPVPRTWSQRQEVYGGEGFEEGRDNAINMDDSDEDLSEDENERESRYAQAQEPFPQHPAFDPELLIMAAKSSQQAAEIESTLKQYTKNSDDIKNMVMKAIDTLRMPVAKKPRIMLLGITGAGKSSTTNSFVDELYASRAASTGKSCTCVPTLLTSQLPGQTLPYAGQVHFMGRPDRRALFQQQMDNYIRFEFDPNPDWDDNLQLQYQLLAASAKKIFLALFCNEPGLDSEGAIRETLKDCYQRNKVSDMVNWLVKRSESLLSDRYTVHDGRYTIFTEARSVQELNDAIDPHIFQTSELDDDAVLWPLVENVVKGFKNNRILQYVDVVDLPGTSDVDVVRGNIAARFIKSCDALWAVSTIERCISKDDLDQMLKLYGKRFGNNIAIIATCSDAQINDALADALRQDGQSVREYAELDGHIANIQRELSHTEKKLKKCKTNKRHCTALNTDEVESKVISLKEQLQSMGNQQFESLVHVRNTFVERELKKTKSQYLSPGAKLKVFCISNTHYQAHKGAKLQDRCQMSVECTGIPQLRAHALELAAPTEFLNAVDYITKTIVLLKGLSLWVDTTPARRHEGLMKVIKQPAITFNADMRQFQNQYATSRLQGEQGSMFVEILNPLLEKKKHFHSAAVEIVQELHNGWHPASISSFIARDGKHCTSTRGHEVWNERFAEEQTSSIEHGWEHMLRYYTQQIKGFAQRTIAQMSGIPEQLKKHPSAVPVPIDKFKSILEDYATRIDTSGKTQVKALDTELSNIKLDATKDIPTAYFTQAMRPMYAEAKGIHGKGCTAEKMHVLQRGLSDLGDHKPFTAVYSGLNQDLRATVNGAARNLHHAIDDILKDMDQTFEGVLRKEAGKSCEHKARVDLKPFLARAMPQVWEMERVLTRLNALAML